MQQVTPGSGCTVTWWAVVKCSASTAGQEQTKSCFACFSRGEAFSVGRGEALLVGACAATHLQRPTAPNCIPAHP